MRMSWQFVALNLSSKPVQWLLISLFAYRRPSSCVRTRGLLQQSPRVVPCLPAPLAVRTWTYRSWKHRVAHAKEPRVLSPASMSGRAQGRPPVPSSRCGRSCRSVKNTERFTASTRHNLPRLLKGKQRNDEERDDSPWQRHERTLETCCDGPWRLMPWRSNTSALVMVSTGLSFLHENYGWFTSKRTISGPRAEDPWLEHALQIYRVSVWFKHEIFTLAANAVGSATSVGAGRQQVMMA